MQGSGSGIHHLSLIFLSLIAYVQAISIRFHLEADWTLHVVDITEEELIEVATLVEGDTNFNFLVTFWWNHSRVWLKSDNAVFLVVDVSPLEVSGNVSIVLQYQCRFTVLRLVVDVLGDTSIDPSQVDRHSVELHMWALDLRVNVEELRESILNHYFKIFLDCFGHECFQANLNTLLRVRC